MTASMASETGVIPDLYFPEDDQELQTSSVEGQEGRGQGGEVKKKEPVDLTKEGFIPIHKLTLEDLPEPIRTEQHLQYILDVSKNVVKINNNGLSSKRPDDDEFKKKRLESLCGSGFLYVTRGKNVSLTTNRHVLFNEDELHKSTFDVFYDYHTGDPTDEKKLWKRCGRQNGQYFNGKFSKDDIVDASYTVKDEMDARIRENCFEDNSDCYSKLKKHPHVAADPNTPPVVCLISHPLGQPKHVSFGELLDYNMHSRTVHHSAPSKPGSSGGRVLVFSDNLIQDDIYHVGWEKGKKYARVKIMEVYPALDIDFGLLKPKQTTPSTKSTLKKITHELTASLDISYLVVFVPIFGAFLLHTQKKCPATRDTSNLKPCKTFPKVLHDLKSYVRKQIQDLTQVAPSFTLCPSSNSSDASDLISLLETQGPCYCQSIVKMMERGSKMEDGTVTECYLSPNTAAAKMSSDDNVTWPWLNRSNSDISNDDAAEECILEKSMALSEEDITPVILLLMIIKANACVKELYLQPCDESSPAEDCCSEGQWETEKTSAAKQWSGERQDSALQGKVKNATSSRAETEGEKRRFAEDILTFLFLVLGHSLPFQTRLPEDKNNVLYSRCVAVTEHAWQHELQLHPDTERGRGNNGGNWCQCGRPGLQEFEYACLICVRGTLAHILGGDANTALILQKIEMNPVGAIGIHAEAFLQRLSQQPHPNLPKNSPAHRSEPHFPYGDTIFSVFNRITCGRQSLMLYLASREAYMYNFCLLVRHISKQLQPRYHAFPVSVFGRPGNWPGNVTPPEVQRTAWRLIQAAIMASGFRPAELAALEEDAERREKLIDLYVDMKQLKWQGKIHPWHFREALLFSASTKCNHVQGSSFFADATHYFVWYATYLVCPQILEYHGSTS